MKCIRHIVTGNRGFENWDEAFLLELLGFRTTKIQMLGKHSFFFNRMVLVKWKNLSIETITGTEAGSNGKCEFDWRVLLSKNVICLALLDYRNQFGHRFQGVVRCGRPIAWWKISRVVRWKHLSSNVLICHYHGLFPEYSVYQDTNAKKASIVVKLSFDLEIENCLLRPRVGHEASSNRAENQVRSLLRAIFCISSWSEPNVDLLVT